MELDPKNCIVTIAKYSSMLNFYQNSLLVQDVADYTKEIVLVEKITRKTIRVEQN